MKNMKYILVSMENWCIFTYTSSMHIANALATGAGDVVVSGLGRNSNKWYGKIKERDMFYEKVVMLDSKNRNMQVVSADTVSDSWRDMQDLLRMRQRAFAHWETATCAALSKLEKHHWNYFDTICEQEIAKSNPDTDTYSLLLEEYARTMDQPVDHVYKDLKLRIESDNAAKFRVQALSDRWKNKINEAFTREELTATVQEMQREFWLNSRI
jgi:hypothetical protein